MLIIGLDGACLDVMLPIIESGACPNLKRLMDNGISGDLESTVHPLTPLAWTSFLSGQNPGRHGIFDFFARDEGSYRFRLVTSAERAGHNFVDLISDSGSRIVSLNVPLTYPPHEINGAVVSGLGTPNMRVEFAYPPELRKKILAKFPDYEITPPYDKGRGPVSEAVLELPRMRTELALDLIDEFEPNVFLMVYGSTDYVQHIFWRDYFDPEKPGSEKEYADLIPRVYGIIDEGIGKLIERMGGDVPVLIISDHGAEGLDLVVGLNRFLADKGYLKFFETSGPGSGRNKAARNLLRKISATVQPILPKGFKETLKSMFPGLSKRMVTLWNVPDMSAVDFAASRAYAVGSYGGIFINLKGREPRGTVNPGKEYESLRDEIASALTEWVGPGGVKIVNEVKRREELYAGPYLDRAPDLIVRLAPRIFTKTTFEPEKEELYKESEYSMFVQQHQSIHAMYGVCIASGYPFIQQNRESNGGDTTRTTIHNARIIDMAPTILHLLGLAIPEDMDGIPLDGLFDSEWYAGHPPRTTDKKGSVTRQGPRKLSEEEEKKLKDELQGLGYIQ